jgi:ribosomal-protein-alanine N-acetyltransferase
MYEKQLIDLMNNPLVGKHLPLLGGVFSEENCREFLRSKKQIWEEHGIGPWVVLVNNDFAGWGGLQPENGEMDFALVLHPDFWGYGRKVFDKVKNIAFVDWKLESITALLPIDRPNSKAITRFGFVEDGNYLIDGQQFVRFRLLAMHV